MDYRDDGVEKWIEFFLDGVIETAESAIATAKLVTKLRERTMGKISTMNKTSIKSTMKILPKLFAQPIVTVATVQKWTGFTTRTGPQKLINRLVDEGILKMRLESTKYDRSYIFQEYLDIFEQSLN